MEPKPKVGTATREGKGEEANRREKVEDAAIFAPRRNLRNAGRVARSTVYNALDPTQATQNGYGLRTPDGHFNTELIKFVASRCLCIPFCLFFFAVPIAFALRYVDEAFPTIGSVPASARELGFGDMRFVHLYWPPSPPPSG